MDEKQNIFHMVTGFYPTNGIGALLRNYQAADHGTLTVITMGMAPQFKEEDLNALMDGIRILSLVDRLRGRPFQKRIRRLCKDREKRDRLYARELRKILREESPDCIHVHYAACLKVLDDIRTHLKGVRLVFTCHSLPERIFLKEPSEWDEVVKRLMRENGLRLVALYGDMKTEVDARFGVTDTVVINNGIDLDRFRHPSRDRETVRRELSIPEDALVLGHVGYFFPAKNQKFLIRLFLEAVSKSDTAFFLFVSDGAFKKLAEERLISWGLEDRFLCLGNRGDIPELLSAMDVFVMPSTHEGFSMALLEAQEGGTDGDDWIFSHWNRVMDLTVEEDRFRFYTECYLRFRTVFAVWLGVYRHSIVREHQILFVDTGKIYAEDLLFNFQYFLYAKKLVQLRDVLYHYRARSGSLVRKTPPAMQLRRVAVLTECAYQSVSEAKLPLFRENFYQLYFHIMNFHMHPAVKHMRDDEIRKVLDELCEQAFHRGMMDEIRRNSALFQNVSSVEWYGASFGQKS